MNPFMMSNIFFGPMGMSVSPMCGCGVSMPYYGNNDNLTFMNFPVFRNIASDYLLDPRLAMMQCQQNYMQGSIFGNSMLPMFNNFPGFPQMGFPWLQPTKTETPEEKEKREAKETEAKKPEAKKATALKKTFDNIKKLAENKKNHFPKIPEELIKKAEDAMKLDKASEQLKAMKEVFKDIPDNVIRKTILADDEIKKQLRVAGYNFGIDGNKYSLNDDETNENDITHKKRITALRSDIENLTYKYDELGALASQLGKNNPDNILRFISAWNSSNSEKLFDLIAEHIPEGNDSVQLKQAEMCVVAIAEALVAKADEYSGYPEINRLKTQLTKKISAVSAPSEATIKDRKTIYYTREKLKDLSKVFNELYTRLRMQEAVKIRNSIKENDNYKFLNEVKEGIFNDDMIVEETMKDLEEEGFTNYPKVNQLDPEPVTEDIIVSEENKAEEADEEYKDNPKGLVDEYLVGEKKVLSKVSGTENIYQTKAYDEKNNGIRYFTVKNNKLIEAKKDKDGNFVTVKDAKEVTAKDICSYDLTVKRLNNLLNTKALEECKNANLPYPVFKATGANEFYALIDGTLGKIEKCTGLSEDAQSKKIKAVGTDKTLDEITADDLAEFKDEKVKSKAAVEEEKKEKAEEDVKKVTAKAYNKIDDIDNSALDELSKITGKDDDFEETSIKGYYYCKSKNRYYVYNQETGKLDYLRGVTKISDTGYMIKNGQWLPCTEIINVNKAESGSEELANAIQEYAKAFAKDLNGVTSDEEYTDAKKRLNTFTSFKDPEYIVNFIKGYKAYGGFWSNGGICKEISTEYGLKDGTTHTDKESKRYYIKWIAIRMKEVVNKTNFSKRSEEYKLLDQIARGELAGSITNTAEQLDKIIDKIIEAYDKKQQG